MQARIEFPTKDTFTIDVIEHMQKNGKDEEIFWIQFADRKYTQEEELCILECLEELKCKESSIKGCVLGLLGGLYTFTQQSYKDTKKGIDYLQNAATLKNTYAMVALANMHKNGFIFVKNSFKAITLFKEASELNNLVAKYNLGIMYKHSAPAEAAALFRESSSIPDSKANLKKLSIENPNFDLITYHYTMELAPETLKNLFAQNAKMCRIGDHIIADTLIKSEKEKFNLFLNVLEYQSNPDQFITYALSASYQVRTFLIKHLMEDEQKPHPDTAVLFRQYFNEPNSFYSQIKNQLQSFKKDYPDNDSVQYHCVMVLDASQLKALFDKSPQSIGELILKDSLLTNEKKQELFLNFFEYNAEQLSTYALKASDELRQCITHILNDTSLLVSKRALALRTLYKKEPTKAESQLALLKSGYPNCTLVQYHCIMTLEPQNLFAFHKKHPILIDGYLGDDPHLIDEEKYQIISKLLNLDSPKLVSYALTASPKIKAIILEKVIIQEFGSIEKAAFELRKYYHSPIGNTKSKLEFLGNHYPDNATVQYHYTLALGATNVNTLYNKWPNEISQCILNDELLTYKDKYKLFNEIKKTNNFPAFSKNVLDLITTQEALEKKENLSIKKLPLYTNSMREIKTINNFTCTFSGISPDLTVTITSDDDFFALKISPEIMKTIYNCNTLSDLSNSLKAEEVKKKNSGFILNDLTHLIDQYASIFSVTSNENATQETVSNAVETKEAFTFTKKSTTTVAKNTYPKDLDVNDSLILAQKYLEQAVKLYDEEPEVSLRILTNFHLSAEQKYQCFMTIMGESDLEKNPLPESVTLFIAEQESKELATITNASHVESSSATQVTLSNTHRINNFVCEFDVATDGILLVITSDNNDRAYLYVSEDNQKEILSCTDLRSLAQILNSSGIKKLNELSNIPIVNIIEQDADILDACSYSKETTENVPQNATGNPHIFFKASHVAVDSKAENDKNSSTELAQAGLNQ